MLQRGRKQKRDPIPARDRAPVAAAEPRPDARSTASLRSRVRPGRRPSPETRLERRMALSGKRILITGGAGFIGTTLARRLVDGNQVVALDNLHRDVLANTALADHPNF